MALDITLCIVPPEIDQLITKAKSDAAYAEWLAFVPTILHDGPRADMGDKTLRALHHDVTVLKRHYDYSPADHLADPYRLAATLDHLLDRVLDTIGSTLQRRILWNGGQRICDACKAVQGVPLKLYSHEEIAAIHTFLQTVNDRQLEHAYNPREMEDAGVYKMTGTEDMALLQQYFRNVQAFFARAYSRHMPVFKVID